MTVVLNKGKRLEDPVAFIRDGKLYLGLNVQGSQQKNGYINTGTGKVISNGCGTIPEIANWSGAELIYPGDSVTITFDGR